MKKTYLLLMVFWLVLTGIAWSGAYMTRSQALDLAFPAADRVETVNLYLDQEQVGEVERLTGSMLKSPIYTFYQGWAGDQVVGYATIEAATVRTHPETVMVVLTPQGQVRFVEVLAFFEPEEYLPSKRWLAQFVGQELSGNLRVGGEIQGITGATLSAQAITRQVRKVTALLGLLLKEQAR
jgi:Na+-translocating ferredoxin:NAD+ oxidoreductase RnfG subunit